MHFAILQGHSELASWMATHPAVDRYQLSADGWNALHCASWAGEIAVLQFLCANGYRSQIGQRTQGPQQLTAAELAKARGFQACVDILAAALSQVRSAEASRRGLEDALLKAAKRGAVKPLRSLLESLGGPAAASSIRTRTGWNLLMLAAKSGSISAVEYLLHLDQLSLDLLEVNNRGWNALHIAASAGNEKITRALMGAGISSLRETSAGASPADIAQAAGHIDLAAYLHATAVATSRAQRSSIGDPARGGSSPASRKVDDTGVGDELVAEEHRPARNRRHRHRPQLLFAAGSTGGGSLGPKRASYGLMDGRRTGRGMNRPLTQQMSPVPSPAVAAPIDPATASTAPVSSDVLSLLTSLGLLQYVQALADDGFDDLPALSCVENGDLEAMGMKKGQRRLLLKAAAAIASTTTLVPPSLRRAVSSDSTHSTSHSAGDMRGVVRSELAGLGPSLVRATSAPIPPADSAARHEAASPEITGDFERIAWPHQRKESDGSVQSGQSGETIGRLPHQLDPTEFSFGKVIGEGSFGVVRKAKWHGMVVAVKTLKVGAALGESDVMAGDACNAGTDGIEEESRGSSGAADLRLTLHELSHEAHVMARVCSHDHIVHFIGVLVKPRPAIVTAFMELGSLEDVLVVPSSGRYRRAEFQLKDLLKMAAHAAAGILHLHHESVVHRDIAARNCLLDASMCVRVADFGFSRLRENRASKGVTKSTTGPVKWMAPEAIRRRLYSSKSDVFSFGTLLYEIFVGKLPWDGRDNVDVMFEVCSGNRMSLETEALPSQLCQLIQECWSHEPAERPDMAAVHDVLSRMLDSFEEDGDNHSEVGCHAHVVLAQVYEGHGSEVLGGSQHRLG